MSPQISNEFRESGRLKGSHLTPEERRARQERKQRAAAFRLQQVWLQFHCTAARCAAPLERVHFPANDRVAELVCKQGHAKYVTLTGPNKGQYADSARAADRMHQPYDGPVSGPLNP